MFVYIPHSLCTWYHPFGFHFHIRFALMFLQDLLELHEVLHTACRNLSGNGCMWKNNPLIHLTEHTCNSGLPLQSLSSHASKNKTLKLRLSARNCLKITPLKVRHYKIIIKDGNLCCMYYFSMNSKFCFASDKNVLASLNESRQMIAL